jgi:hypothetical protein
LGALQEWGFILDHKCIANKVINGKQCTILWHVDDFKLSHEDKDVVSGNLKMMNNWDREISPLVVSQGKIHDYLGMTLDFSMPGKCIIQIGNYVKKNDGRTA